MQNSLDMSLDDLIHQSKKPSGDYLGNSRYQHHGRFSGPVSDRRFLNRAASRVTPYSTGPQNIVSNRWSNAQGFTKLYLSNLDYDVSDEDLQVLFSEVGVLEHHSIHYDRSGRSKGTGEVVFARPEDAIAAMKRYNHVLLDGKPLKIELVGHDLATQLDLPPTGDGILGKPNSGLLSVYGHGRAQLWAPVRGRSVVSGHGRARGMVKNDAKKVTAQDLDAELERYHLEALHIEE